MDNGKLRIEDRLRQRREINQNFATVGRVGVTLDEASALETLRMMSEIGLLDELAEAQAGGAEAGR